MRCDVFVGGRGLRAMNMGVGVQREGWDMEKLKGGSEEEGRSGWSDVRFCAWAAIGQRDPVRWQEHLGPTARAKAGRGWCVFWRRELGRPVSSVSPSTATATATATTTAARPSACDHALRCSTMPYDARRRPSPAVDGEDDCEHTQQHPRTHPCYRVSKGGEAAKHFMRARQVVANRPGRLHRDQ